MRRVLLLVCLIVSVVELDWERERIYLLSSVASLLLVLYGELMRRPKVQRLPLKELSRPPKAFPRRFMLQPRQITIIRQRFAHAEQLRLTTRKGVECSTALRWRFTKVLRHLAD